MDRIPWQGHHTLQVVLNHHISTRFLTEQNNKMLVHVSIIKFFLEPKSTIEIEDNNAPQSLFRHCVHPF